MSFDVTLRVLNSHIENVGRNFESWIALFADDAVLESPYLVSLGMPTRIEGRDAIRTVLGGFLASMENFHLADVRIFAAANPERVFAEYSVDATVKASNRPYQQNYLAMLEVRDGKIVLLREYLDVIVAAKALLPKGLSDVP